MRLHTWKPAGWQVSRGWQGGQEGLDEEGLPYSSNPISSRKHPLASFLHSETKHLRRSFPNKTSSDLGSSMVSCFYFCTSSCVVPHNEVELVSDFPLFVVSGASLSNWTRKTFQISLCPNLELSFYSTQAHLRNFKPQTISCVQNWMMQIYIWLNQHVINFCVVQDHHFLPSQIILKIYSYADQARLLLPIIFGSSVSKHLCHFSQ